MKTDTAGMAGAFLGGAFEPVTHQDTSAENRQLFFAKVAKSAGEDEIKALFSEYGSVLDVIIFQSSQGSQTSKGCGLVTMATHAQAAAAIAGLHGKFCWSNRDPPMVVTWMDAALQDPSRQAGASRGGSKLGIGKGAGGMDGMPGSGPVDPGSGDFPPPGADPDAIKLFVGNIPLSHTEEQLIPIFTGIGPVVELVVVRNKQTGQSKGCAFVWFKERAAAEEAIVRLNLRHVLNDTTGQQTRPLVVRRARTGHIATPPPPPPPAPLPVPKHSMGGGVDGPADALGNGSMGISGGGASGLRSPMGGLGARLLQHQFMAAGGQVGGGAPTMPLSAGVGASLSQTLLKHNNPSLSGLGQRLMAATTASSSSSSMLVNNMLASLHSAPALNNITPGTAQHGTALRHPASVSSMNNLPPAASTHLGAAGLGAHLTGAAGAANAAAASHRVLGSAPGLLGSAGLLGGAKMDFQPITVHQLPNGTYVSSAGLGMLQPGLGAGTGPALGSPSTASVTATSQPYNHLVVDMQQPSPTFDIQRLNLVGGEDGAGASPLGSLAGLQQAMAGLGGGNPNHDVLTSGVLQLDTVQLTAVNDHLYSIQACAGAQVMVSPGGPGMFSLLFTGSPAQIEQAQLMVASLLSSSHTLGGM